ncbi:hypothetical protein ACTNEM_07180 [Eubacterium pyruvativorans]|uniref:hypothetical protein n=1 Tax=Eubacterium pyruvativorans TaxID=155865 RepID=UPI003F8B71EF
MVKSSKKVLAVLLAVACLITFMPAMASQSFAAKKLTVKPAKKTIYVKKSVTLKANQKVKWSASKASLKVVKLTSKKAKSVKVTGKKAGKAVVTAKVGKQTKKVTITVKKAKAAVKKTAVTAVALSADNAGDPATKVVVGTKLRAAVTPENATVTYQWKADGTAIAGATGSTFTVTTAEIGKAITVEVTGTGNFEKTAVSAATAKVSTPSITGVVVKKYKKDATQDDQFTTAATPAIGETLKAKVTTTNAQSASDVATFQWYRTLTKADQSGSYDVAIDGATSETYKVTAADKGAKIYVKVTPKAGVTLASGVTTERDGSIKCNANNGTDESNTPVVGTVAVELQANGEQVTSVAPGTKLTAVVTPAEANVTYQWKKGGVAINGATSSEYTPTEIGNYSVEVKLADSERTYTFDTGLVKTVSFSVTQDVLNDVLVTDTNNAENAENKRPTAEKRVLATDTFAGVAYKKNDAGKDEALAAKDVKYTFFVNGKETTEAGISAGSYTLKDTAGLKNLKVGDVITVKGTYNGFSKMSSNSLKVGYLDDASNVYKDVTAAVSTDVNTKTLTVSGLEDLKDGFTVTVKLRSGEGSAATYTTIGTLGYKDVKVVNNVGTAKLALDYDNAKVNANTLEVTVSGEGYYGTKTVTVTGN